MIIQFTGTGSTGKTTVSDLLAEKYGFNAIRESAREIAKEQNVAVDTKANPEIQAAINERLFRKFIKAVNEPDMPHVFDRSFICCYAYTMAGGYATAKLLRQINALTTLSVKIVDGTFYFPPVIDFVQDDVRVKDSRDIVDSHIREYLSTKRIASYTVEKATPEERAELIMKILKGRGLL